MSTTVTHYLQKASRLRLVKGLCRLALVPMLLLTGRALAQHRQSFPQTAASQQLAAKAEGWMKEQVAGFTENKGQINDQNGKLNNAVKYLLNMPGLNVQLRAAGFSYDAWQQEKSKTDTMVITKFHRVDISLEGANANAQLVTEEPAGGVMNRVNEHGEIDNIRSFRKVTYKDIYPGIDLEFVAQRGTEKPVEYNFIIHPGADAARIKMRYNSGSDIDLKDGKINMKLAFGTLEEKIPASFTQQDGKSLAVQYQSLNEVQNEYAFNVPDYDRTQTLVIDPTPTLAWATYYGGTGDDEPYAATVDANGILYVAGDANSTTNIASGGSVYQSQLGGTGTGTIADAFVAAFSSTGTRLWGTYFGVTGAAEIAYGVTTTNTGVCIAGYINQGTIPASAGLHAYVTGDVIDAFIAKFNLTNGSLIWNTYFGSTGNEYAYSIASGTDGSIFIAGNGGANLSYNSAGPVYTGTGSSNFIAKLTADGVLVWSSYCDMGASLGVIYAVAVDTSNNPYVGGYATLTTTASYATLLNPSSSLTQGQVPSNYGIATATDAYVARYNTTTGALTWGRFFGGTATERFCDIAIDRTNGALYGVGYTTSANGIATPGAFQTSLGAATWYSGYLAKFSLDGYQQWGTYLTDTTTAHVYASGVGVDNAGNVYVTGINGGTNTSGAGKTALATNCSSEPVSLYGKSLYLDKFSANGTLIWGTYFGNGTQNERNSPGRILAVDPANGNNYLTSTENGTTSTLSTAGSWQPTNNGGNDVLIAKFNDGLLPPNFAVAASTLTPLTQNACALGLPTTIVGNSVTVTAPITFATGIFYQWQTAGSPTGPWIDLAGESFKDLTPPTGSSTAYFRRLVKANNGYCNLSVVDSSATAAIVITGNIAPVANANGPQWMLCSGNAITLNGSATPASGATISSYAWYVGNATTAAATTATYAPTNITAATTYTLKVTDNHGCTDIDQVTVTPEVANAGPAVSYCTGTSGVQIGTTPVSGITYAWAPATGLSATNVAQPIAHPTVTTTYTLTITVPLKAGGTCTSTSTVTVTPVAAPNGAGTDVTICKGNTATLGATAVTGFTYTWTPGTFLSSTTATNPVFSAGTTPAPCPQTYTVTAVSGTCSFQDQVNVSVIDADIDFGGQTFCGPGWVSGTGTANNCTGATYTWTKISGAGTGTVVSTRNGGADAYLQSTGGPSVYQRTTTVNGVTCTSASVTVNDCGSTGGCGLLTIKQLSSQGCPKVFAGQPLQLTVNGITTADYNFSWSPAALVDNPTASVVNITSTTPATITVTVTNKYNASISCSASLAVNNSTWALPVVSLTDKNTCPATAVQIGVPTVSGYNYTWLPATNLSNAANSNPTATLTTTTSYSLQVVEAATGCQVTKSMTVNVSTINYDAGPDRGVCNNGTVTLGTTPGGSYTYSWTPVNGAWQNGTGPTSVNPQVLFAGTAQTYGVTVTDPLTGCTLTDAVTLSGTVAAGTYAGSAVPASVCSGSPSLIGASALSGASYLWTPATGLSNATVANPTASPTATTTYTVAVSYPGCATPVTDNVTVTVKAVTAFDFVNQTICASTPTNIGVGGTGNPTSIANAASYSWSPATGLSCTTCASPNASPVTATTYSCTVTFSNGCTASDNVTVTPKFTASAKPDAVICAGNSVVLGLPAAANVTYAWSPATGLSAANVAQPTATPTVTTIYTLTATGTGANAGCVITDAVNVTVNTPTPFTITGNPSLCTGGSTVLGFTPANANMIYQWGPTTGVASPNSSSTVLTSTTVGTQLYKLVQTDLATGCSNFQQIQVVTSANDITATGGNVNVCSNSGTALPLTVTSGGTYSYSWASTSFLSNPYVQNPTTYASTTTTYTATITNNTTGCQLVVPSTITVGVCAVAVSGNVFHDGNGLTDNTVNSSGTVTTIPTGLYAALVNSSNAIVATVPVNADGTYNFSAVPAGNYSVVLSTIPAGSATPVLPAGWNSTGAQIGTGTGSVSTTGALPGIVVGTTDVTNANIAIEKLPTGSDFTAAHQANPGGNAQVPVPDAAFSGNDAEDGAYSSGLIGKKVTLNPATNGTLYYNGVAVSSSSTFTNFNPALVTIDPAGTGTTTVAPAFSYSVYDAAGIPSIANTITLGFDPPVTVSGNVWDDSNGDATKQTSEALTNAGGLYAVLTDSLGNVIDTATVNPVTGAYTFAKATSAQHYKITLSTTLPVVGAAISTATLPTAAAGNWTSTGVNVNGTADTSNKTGSISLLTPATGNAANVNFGIDEKPTGSSYTAGTQVNPGGNTQVLVPAAAFTGSDAEDGTYTAGLNGKTITLSPATNGTLYYNGTQVTTATAIPNFNPALLSVDPNGTGATAITPTFTYSVNDAAGQSSAPQTISLPMGVLVPISGTVWDDANGNAIDAGIETGSNAGGLYAVLTDNTGNVIQSVAVDPATGAYSFNQSVAGTAYKVVLSATNAATGTLLTTATLPIAANGNWVSTGVNQNGIPNTNNQTGIIAVTTPATGTLTAQNFGIEETPTGNNYSATTQGNPGGTTQVPVPATAFTGNDAEDGSYTTGLGGQKVVLTPAVNGTLYYNGVSVTAADTIAGFNPALVTVDPAGTTGTVITPAFTYTVIDAAGQGSTPATISMPFAAPVAISGTVWDDADGNGSKGTTEAFANAGGLNAVLTDNTGNVIAVAAVDPVTGAYSFDDAAASVSYKVVLSTATPAIGSTLTTASLPTAASGNWTNTGTNQNGVADTSNKTGIISLTTTATGNTGISFGIDQAPTANSFTATREGNPGSNIQVSVPQTAFSGGDAEDGPYATGLNGKTVTLNPATNGTLYYNGVPVTATTVITGFNPALVTIDPAGTGNTAVTPTFTYSVTDNAGKAATPKTITMPFDTPIAISGTVWDDANGNAVNSGTEPVTNAGGLFAVLTDNNGNVLQSVPVDGATGTYIFADGTTTAQYKVVLSTTNPAPGSMLSAASLPSAANGNWAYTGINQSGAASTADASGIMGISTPASGNVTAQNFGIDQLPMSGNQSYSITQPALNALLSLNGNGSSNSPGPLTGSDAEDQATMGSLSSKSVAITSLPVGSQLFYNGVLISTGADNSTIPSANNPFIIPNYDPSLLQLKLTGNGSTSASFGYSYVDAAGKLSGIPATYAMTWSVPLKLELSYFTATRVDGTGLLSWGTVTEEQTDNFIVERSTDGIQWSNIGMVAAAGNSNKKLDYTLTDEQPATGINYYRLQIMNLDGSYQLSETQQLNFGTANGNNVTIAPNPTQNITRLIFAQPLTGTITVKVLTSSGVIVKTYTLTKGAQSQELDMSSVARGTYLIMVEGNNLDTRLRLMVN